MKFLALIIALLFIQYWGTAAFLHRDEWYLKLRQRLSESVLPDLAQLLTATLLPPLLLFWLLDVFGNWLFGLVGLATNVLVLLYCFGRGDYEGAMKSYRSHCRDGDFTTAFVMTKELFPRDKCTADKDDAEHLHRWMKKRLLYMGFERWFAVIFYFALLGAPGALLYRLSQFSLPPNDGEADRGALPFQVIHWLDWLPSRLLVFAFSLTGDYVGSREQLMGSLRDVDSGADTIVSDAAHAALGLKSTVFTENGDAEAFAQVSDWEMGQLHGLMSRSAVSWVVAISLVVVFV